MSEAATPDKPPLKGIRGWLLLLAIAVCLAPLRTLIDTHLSTFDVIWAAAGTPNTVFATTYDDLARVTGAVTADVAAVTP